MGTIKGGYKWLGAKIGGNSVNGIAKNGNKIFEKNNNNIISSGLYYHISANDPLSYDGTNIDLTLKNVFDGDGQEIEISEAERIEIEKHLEKGLKIELI